MALNLITAPSTEPVSLAEIKTALRIDTTSVEDTMLEGLITTAREYCEDFQNRAYITQVWDLWLDKFPVKDYIHIFLPPLQSVASVKYYGTDDTEYTMDTDDYFVDIKSAPGRVALGYSKSWPTTTLRPVNAVVVRFTAGYGSAASAVPKRVKQAMIIDVKLNYDEYDSEMTRKLGEARDRLLWQSRVVPT